MCIFLRVFYFVKIYKMGISIECGTDCLEFGGKIYIFAYDGYNQQTIHIFVRAIVLILFIFAKKKEKRAAKKYFVLL